MCGRGTCGWTVSWGKWIKVCSVWFSGSAVQSNHTLEPESTPPPRQPRSFSALVQERQAGLPSASAWSLCWRKDASLPGMGDWRTRIRWSACAPERLRHKGSLLNRPRSVTETGCRIHLCVVFSRSSAPTVRTCRCGRSQPPALLRHLQRDWGWCQASSGLVPFLSKLPRHAHHLRCWQVQSKHWGCVCVCVWGLSCSLRAHGL